VPAYTEVDLRVAWQARENLEISVTGFNLLHENHREFGTASVMPRSVLVSAQWSL
jgi:hypothetical protein